MNPLRVRESPFDARLTRERGGGETDGAPRVEGNGPRWCAPCSFRRRLLSPSAQSFETAGAWSCQGRRSRRREAFTAPRDPAVCCRL